MDNTARPGGLTARPHVSEIFALCFPPAVITGVDAVSRSVSQSNSAGNTAEKAMKLVVVVVGNPLGAPWRISAEILYVRVSVSPILTDSCRSDIAIQYT